MCMMTQCVHRENKHQSRATHAASADPSRCSANMNLTHLVGNRSNGQFWPLSTRDIQGPWQPPPQPLFSFSARAESVDKCRCTVHYMYIIIYVCMYIYIYNPPSLSLQLYGYVIEMKIQPCPLGLSLADGRLPKGNVGMLLSRSQTRNGIPTIRDWSCREYRAAQMSECICTRLVLTA